MSTDLESENTPQEPKAAFSDAASGSNSHKNRRVTPPPFSLRLSEAERATLEARAGSKPLGAYIRDTLLGDDQQPRQAHRRPTHDQEAIAQLLAELGNARLANNLNQLAKAANAGALPVNAETLKAILTACHDVRVMRACLLAALGFRP